ncbi:MAG: nucleotidyltransferase [Planctomycetaceae bacterium]|nr:nucleotidyltransferase [Planctomycetaceae bacterium]
MISENVRFVMIGGYAFNLYRNPRATGDIDFLVASDDDNERRLRSVLSQFGFESTLPTPDRRLLESGKVLMLGRSPLRIDLLTTIDGVTFDEVMATRQEFMIDNLRIPVISAETLLVNKRASGRPKDLADVEELMAYVRSRQGTAEQNDA